MSTATRLDPDRLAELEEERDHLLSSLEDLEREHDAGDLDDHDYAELKDDYTARAAEVIRAIEQHRELAERSRPERNVGRTALVVVAVLAVAVVAGLLVARSSGQRGSGTITGNDDTVRQRLASCQTLSFQKPAEGIDCYADILEGSPENLDALTYQGWAYIRDDQVEKGAANLARVVDLDPDYPDARVFRAILLSRAGEAASAKGDAATARESFLAAASEIDRFYRNDPPTVAVQVLQQEGLERTIYFNLIDPAVYSCWQRAAEGSDGSSAIDQAFLDALGGCLDGVIAADPSSVDALLSKALTVGGTADADLVEARSLAERILAIDPQDPNGLLLQASLDLTEGRLDEASALLDRLDGMARPTAAFLIGPPEDMRVAIQRARTGGASATTLPGDPSSGAHESTPTTRPPASVSTVPGAPTIPNAGGG
ncbi:tetratricopeptide repeat protein [Dermatobacter hominis]|uniref:tetratricopeptide repeat protein n=1 Tax=Dermatobacter hominis TaxID=2884263 RepID=UPI001D113585|nr:tetratricopeptide repeat protein [Dermatobacter hominis]UDY37281.1 tetratricopeptide repeat protein [Dermatobacter hominis]